MSNTPPIFIYGLCDPLTGELRYIGATMQSIHSRLRSHIGEAKQWYALGQAKAKWIQELAALGLEPEPFEIEQVDTQSALSAEKFWIQYFAGLGCPLTNMRGFVDGKGARSKEDRCAYHICKRKVK